MLKRLVLLIVLGWCLPALASTPPSILVVGDSLSAAFGIPLQSGWVQLLQQRLEKQGYPHRVINASVSGDTSRTALSRLDGLLERHQPVIVIVEIGGNDGLQALGLQQLEINIRSMIIKNRDHQARTLLVGMQIPPNYGMEYAEGFAGIYPQLAEEQGIPLVPFLLEGVATHDDMMQEDNIHPSGKGQPLMLDNVWLQLEKMLTKE